MSDTRAPDQTTELYRYFDSDDRLLYVGISLSAIARAQGHKREAGWWTDWARSTVERFPTRPEAIEAERIAIINEQPIHNVIHNDRSDNRPVQSIAATNDHGLQGLFFLTPDAKHGWPLGEQQGRIVRHIGGSMYENIYLVTLYSWWDGQENGDELRTLDAMLDWHFYSAAEEWREAGSDVMRAREWHHRDIDGGEACPHCPTYKVGTQTSLDDHNRRR